MGIAFCPEERGIFASLDVRENLLLPPIVRAGGLSLDQIFDLFPNLKERLNSQGTKLSGGEQQMLAIAQNPAHRRALPDAGRADRGPGARHHPADRPHHRAAEVGGLHHPAGRAEFPLRLDGRGPLLHRRARQGHRRFCEFGAVRPIWTSSTPISASESALRLQSESRRQYETAEFQLFCSAPRWRLPQRQRALAQDKTVKIGVLTDNSGLYSDLGGAGSTLAAQMAVEDSGLAAKGWKIDMISADHQNKPDIGTTIARQWIDVEKVDIFMDVLNSGVALAVNNRREGKERRHDQYRRGDVGSHQRPVLAEHRFTGSTTPTCSPTAPGRRW